MPGKRVLCVTSLKIVPCVMNLIGETDGDGPIQTGKWRGLSAKVVRKAL